MSEDRKDKRTREGVLLCETPSFSKFLDLPYRILFSNSSETKRKPLHRSGKHDTRLGSVADVIIVISATSRACVKFLMVNIF